MKSEILFGMSLLALTPAARAETVADLRAYLEEQIQLTQQAVEESGADSCMASAADAANEGWYFRNFLLRLRPRFGIEVEGFSKFQIQPEAELVFERPFPAGWSSWKPQK